MKKNYLLSSIFGAMLMAMPVSADVIGMQTAVAVGEKISIALNEDVKATLTWGNGDSEDIVFHGEEVEITVKDADFTLTTAQSIMTLYCPNCSLTQLNLVEAPHLVSLVCPNNQLTTLKVDKNTRLQELNCEHNQLSTLTVSACKELLSLNVGSNELNSLSLSSLANLKTLICSYNNLKALSLSGSKSIETLWCQGNDIKSLSFAGLARPMQVCAFENELTTLNVNNLENVKELWLDDNKFTKLDLANSTVTTLSASDNNLNLVLLNEDTRREFEAFYVDGNSLTLNSFPSVFNQSTKDSIFAYNIDNQRPYVYAEKVNINEVCDFSQLIRRNAWGSNTRVKTVWKDGNGRELVKNEDIKISGDKFTFLKPFKSVHAELTSFLYPEATFSIAAMEVVDPTGIEGVADDNSLSISTRSGVLQVAVSASTVVRIYNASGALVVEEALSAGSHSWTLPAGLYIVNGKKVVLSR